MFNNYIHPSFIVNQNKVNISNNNFTTLFIDNCENEEEELIKSTVIHSVNYSNKLVNYCELSGIKLKDKSEDLFLVSSYLRGHENITYFPRGTIFHSNKEKEKLEIANLFFESNYNLIVKHIFNNDEYIDYKIKVKRSNGMITDAWFKKIYGLLYFKKYDKIFIKVMVILKDGSEGFKNINLSEIYKLNPDLPDIDVYIYKSDQYSEWIKKERIIWEDFMLNKLKLTLIDTNKKINIIRI